MPNDAIVLLASCCRATQQNVDTNTWSLPCHGAFLKKGKNLFDKKQYFYILSSIKNLNKVTAKQFQLSMKRKLFFLTKTVMFWGGWMRGYSCCCCFYFFPFFFLGMAPVLAGLATASAWPTMVKAHEIYLHIFLARKTIWWRRNSSAGILV